METLKNVILRLSFSDIAEGYVSIQGAKRDYDYDA